MNNNHKKADFSSQIGRKEVRKLNARSKSGRNIWFGLGMFGLIGWSVALPTVLGALLGIWLDRHYPSGHSWTLALLTAGIVFGCFCAWHWVSKENKAIQKDQKKNNE